MTVAIVAAKGQSERLPGKNLKLFCGHPLVAWSIVNAVNSHLIEETYVSTDDDRIAQVSEQYGARIIWRDYDEHPKAPANVPYSHAIRKLGLTWGDDILTVLPTSPTVRPSEYDEMIRRKRELGVNTICAAVRQPEPTVYKQSNDTQMEVVMFAKDWDYMTQGGGFAVSDAGWYLESNGKIKEEVTSTDQHNPDTRIQPFFERPLWACFDIDYDFEFELLEFIMEYYILKGRGMEIYYDYGAKRDKE